MLHLKERDNMWTWNDYDPYVIVRDIYQHYEQQNIIIALLVLIIILQIINLIQKHKVHTKSKNENEDTTKEKNEWSKQLRLLAFFIQK